MKYLLYLMICGSLTYANTSMQVTVSGAQSSCMPLTVMVLDKTNKELLGIAQTIKKDLEFTDQFSVSIQSISTDISKKELLTILKKKLYKRNSSCSLP